MNDEIRIRLSVGLLVVAAMHAVLFGGVAAVLRPDECNDCQPSWNVPQARVPTTQARTVEKLVEPQEVNLQAQGEIKQQRPRRNPCPPGMVPVRVTTVPAPTPARPTPKKPEPAIVIPAAKPTGAGQSSVLEPAAESDLPKLPSPTEPAPIVIEPAASPVTDARTPPPAKSYQIALFVSGDAQSKQLIRWFSQYRPLATLKDKCEFQVYTAENALYQTRFASLVPESQFPVLLFQDATGGHVHAAGRTMLPSTADQLYDDLEHSYELYKQTREAQKTGALKEKGYSWDAAISPTLQLAPEDCPDGYCPVEPDDRWRPFDRDRDDRLPLFDGRDNDRSALIWAGAGELATLALVFVAVVLLGFILIKRGL